LLVIVRWNIMVKLDLMEALWVRVISLFSSALLEDNT